MPSKIIWISQNTLAEAIHCHPDTVRRYVRRGLLPPYDVDITPRCRRWRLETLKKFPKVSVLVIEYLKHHPDPPL
jgi:hypothetical protein